MAPRIAHLHTYFLFPFSLDKEALLEDHREVWQRRHHWMEGLDQWIAAHHPPGSSAVADSIGPWRRAANSRFDMDSPAYQDMVFFHPSVRRVFFDTTDASGASKESLLRCYAIPIPPGSKVWLEARDRKGRGAAVQVTDLRLFLFANGIGILSIGIEAHGLSLQEALWINESMRKVYPSSGRQLRESRAPDHLILAVERESGRQVVVEERFEQAVMCGLQPPLARTVTALLYFADYARQEYEPVLDERMIVYTYVALDPATLPPGFIQGDDYPVLLSRFLYVDRLGPGYRYEHGFTRAEMERQVYRRWAHEGTYYGFTSYSNLTATIGPRDCDEHQLAEGFLIHRMFDTRYYLMAVVALFYRATLLDFSVRTALVSKLLFLDQEDGALTLENIHKASDLRAEFLHFTNYWYFSELANKDEEVEHFTLQARECRIEPMKLEIEEEIEKLNASLDSYYHFRSTDAVNRLGMISLLLGAGAVLTGFFGMNFGREFGRLFFEPSPEAAWAHYAAVLGVALLAFGALTFGVYVVLANWADYRHILVPRAWMRRKREGASLKRG